MSQKAVEATLVSFLVPTIFPVTPPATNLGQAKEAALAVTARVVLKVGTEVGCGDGDTV
jgi:hypothetical protein